MNKEEKETLLEKVWQNLTVDEIVEAGVKLKKITAAQQLEWAFKYCEKDSDKDEIKVLCDQIKQLMKEQGRDKIIYYKACEDELDDTEIHEKYNINDEDLYDDLFGDFEEASLIRNTICEDEWDYEAIFIILGGIILDNDELKFYLIKINHDSSGWSEDKEVYVRTIDDITDFEEYDESDITFDLKSVLEPYLEHLSDGSLPS